MGVLCHWMLACCIMFTCSSYARAMQALAEAGASRRHRRYRRAAMLFLATSVATRTCASVDDAPQCGVAITRQHRSYRRIHRENLVTPHGLNPPKKRSRYPALTSVKGLPYEPMAIAVQPRYERREHHEYGDTRPVARAHSARLAEGLQSTSSGAERHRAQRVRYQRYRCRG